MFLVDLLRQVVGTLRPAHGGTGSTYGEGRVVQKCINSTGADLPLYTLVQLKGTANDKRVIAVADADSTRVLGVVAGYFDIWGNVVEADAPDGGQVAVQTAGEARVLIEGAVTRDQFAYAAATDGTAYSSASAHAGAFGLFIDSADAGEGHETARVMMPVAAALIGGGESEAGWELVIDESGSSAGGITGASGTWGSDGTWITQTDTTATPRRAKFNTGIRTAALKMQAEVQILSTGANTPKDVGLLLGFDGSNQYGAVARLDATNDKVEAERENNGTTKIAYAFTVDTETTYKLGAVRFGNVIDLFVDDVWYGSVDLARNAVSVSIDYSFVGLYSFAASVKFKNIKVWIPNLPSA